MNQPSQKENDATADRNRCVLVVIAICLFILVIVAFHHTAQAQKRRPRKPAPRRTVQAPVNKYSQFSHATQKHRGACNSCHKVPTDNWRKVSEFPDVTDYPGHDACVSCHRPQFFKGLKPPICSVCHSKVSPRDDLRFAFAKPTGSRQFLIEFPHDKHQDVIAKLRFPLVTKPDVQFVRASFSRSSFFEEQPKRYNNCEICHQPRTSLPERSTFWPDGVQPDAATFKASPASHSSCFNCHWKSQQPVNDNCGGCHRLGAAPVQNVDFGKRISLRFRHAREQHIAECTTCHINITKSATLRGLKPDVPITSCTECHNKSGLREDVNKELAAVDQNHDFVCVYCHTSDVGKRDAPPSHYLIAERPPVKRKDLK